MQCQFCKQTLEDVDAIQLHQVASCPAMSHSSLSLLENDMAEVVFKWLIDRVVKVPAVFLIGSDMDDNIELKKSVACFKSRKISMPIGKYSGQLVIDNDVAPINDFEIAVSSEVVHLIVNSDSSMESIEREVISIERDSATHSRKSSRRGNGDMENALSPLHQEMLDHQIKNDYDFVDAQVPSNAFGSILSEENVKGDSTSIIPDDATLHQTDDLSPDFSRVSRLPRDSDADDSFYHSFATPPVFETIDPDSPPSTPRNNPSLYVNIKDLLSDISIKDDDEEPSMQSHVAVDLISHELEDAMRENTPGSSREDLNTLLGENGTSPIHIEHDDRNVSVDYAGNPMSTYDQPFSVDNIKQNGQNGDNIYSIDHSGNPVGKNEDHRSKKKEKQTGRSESKEKEMQMEIERMADLIENYKEVKVDLETKCASYDHEILRLNNKCVELEKAASQNDYKDIIDEKDGTINELNVKADSFESEMNRLNQEVVHLTELLEEDKAALLQEKSDCHSYKLEIQHLNERCTELEQDKEVESLTKLLAGYQENKAELEAKCDSYNTEMIRLTNKCTDLEKMVAELQQANQKQTVDSNHSKDNVITELNGKVNNYESEMDILKKELQTTKEKLEEHKIEKLQLETKCGKYELETKQLSDKCTDFDKQKELHKLSETLETYKEEKLHMDTKCAAYDNEVKLLQEKCSRLERENENQAVSNESEIIKDRIIGDLKVKAESYETELSRLNQEVKNLTELVDEYKNIKLVLESKCQSYENEIESLKGGYQNPEQQQKINDMMKVCKELEQKCTELQTSNQKLMEDYKGLEVAKNVHEEEVQAERERYEGMIKELMNDKSKLSQISKQDNRYSDNHARMNINKLKSENKILKEKLNLIRNESELNDSTTSKENISPRLSGYKPPLLPTSKSYEPENIKAYSFQPPRSSRTSRHKHTTSNDDYTLPSRYNATKYSTSPENYDKTDFVSHITEHSPTYTNNHLDDVMKRYSSPTNVDLSSDSIRGRCRSRPNSYHDPLSYCNHNGVSQSKLFGSSSRSRSLDHLDSSGAEETSAFYKPKSLVTIPFCPTSVKELLVGMKISVNRANGRLSRGVVKWIGTLPRHSGEYVGVELESEVGKHDGTLNGVQYFKCKGDRGIFVKFPKVIMAWK